MTNRWAAFTHRETMDIHHALRVFAKYPGLSDEEKANYTALADEIWDWHTTLGLKPRISVATGVSVSGKDKP